MEPNQFVLTQPNELQALIKSAVNEALNGYQSREPQGKPAKKDWLTGKEVCEILNISSRTLQNIRDRRALSFFKSGKKILYPVQGVNDYLNNRLIKERGSK